MAKDDNPGLLSKVVRFVKSPMTNWADLDQQESDRESTYNKQVLKEMIERKRRNDFVRKREFDMLRKMRRKEAMTGNDAAARPSFFQSSLPSKPDDRAMTLKKIDEIEAQMSMQWWKTKHGESMSTRTTNFPLSSLPPGETTPQVLDKSKYSAASGGASARPTQAAPTASAPTQPMAPSFASTLPPPTAPMPVQAIPARPVSAATAAPVSQRAPAPGPQQIKAPILGGLAGAYDGGTTGFSASKLFAVEVDDFAHDPELEEAAIRFANGDDEGAEAGLKEALGPRGSRADHEETWMTLFDLYRATGKQEKFEDAAIDYAGRFDRSAPLWFSIPDMVGRMAGQPAAHALQEDADWTSPASLGMQSVAALQVVTGKVPQPWKLNWSKLTAVESGARESLMRLFVAWANQPVQLRFMGADHLEKILQAATPSGDRSVDAGWWKLRMECLRLMHRADEFELAALDYCVTYEVSPPSWESARCEYKPLDEEGGYMPGHTIVGEAFRDSMNSTVGGGFGDTQINPHGAQMAVVSTVELAGQVVGDAAAALEKIEERLLGSDVLVISCAKLIRVDFSAAGTLLNWVSARQTEGRHVQFTDAHRLVAAFFSVIGISEHARVTPRHD